MRAPQESRPEDNTPAATDNVVGPIAIESASIGGGVCRRSQAGRSAPPVPAAG
jgi:hypothetical protein